MKIRLHLDPPLRTNEMTRYVEVERIPMVGEELAVEPHCPPYKVTKVLHMLYQTGEGDAAEVWGQEVGNG
jgi:hypothetical protein